MVSNSLTIGWDGKKVKMSSVIPYMLRNWDHTRRRVKRGLEKLGHDIPLAGYSIEEDLKAGSRKNKKSKKEASKS